MASAVLVLAVSLISSLKIGLSFLVAIVPLVLNLGLTVLYLWLIMLRVLPLSPTL